MADTESVEYIISLRDRAVKALGRNTKAVRVNDQAWTKLGGTITRFVGIAAIGSVVKNSVQLMMDYEKSISNLAAITGATGDDLEFMKRKSLELAQASTVGAKETVEAFKLIASAKPELLSNAAALANTTKEAITLSEASGLLLPNAAKSLTSALNQFDLAASESGRVINVLAAGSKFAAAEIPDLAASLEEFGGVAKSLNISLEESAAAVETLSLKNLKGRRAGIQMRNVLLKLGATADKKLNPKIVGLSTTLERLAPIQDNITELTKRFGSENVLAAQTLIKQRKRFDELTKSVTGTSVAYEQARIATDNLSGDIDRLGSSWEVFVLNLNKGEGVITNAFRNITDLASEFLMKLDRINKSDKQIVAENLSDRMQNFISTLTDVKTRDDLFTRLLESRNEALKMNERMLKRVEELGGIKAVQEAGKGVTGFYNLRFNRKRELERIAVRELLAENQEFAIQISEILGNEAKLAKILQKIQPVKVEPEIISPGAGGTTTPRPDFKAKKQISTITGAAPKTFNINVNNLINEFNVNTENITEGANEVKKQITIALAEALADVEPITN